MNLCDCGLDFGSVTAFDRHRVGVHEYTFQEGVKFDPPVYNGRRCLDESELAEKGFVRNSFGRWSLEEGLLHARTLRETKASSP